MGQPTTPEDTERINACYSGLQETMLNLYARWQDEKEYEDIADYAAVIKLLLPAGFSLMRMRKSPFGFEFSIGTDAVYQMEVKVRSFGWRRIK